jgi:transketolase
MRNTFARLLNEEMYRNPRVRMITADLGYGILDTVRKNHWEASYNVGAAEQLMLGVGIGMAEEGLIPVCYSMSSFVLYRPFEFIRNYLNHEGTNVKLVGSGRDQDYEHDGISHWAHDDEAVLASVPRVKIYKPATVEELEKIFPEYINSLGPAYLNLKRKR